MYKYLLLMVLFSSFLLQAQLFPPQWSAYGWNCTGWNGNSIDSSSTFTYTQDTSATQGTFSQLFSSGGATQFLGINLHLFNIYWTKYFPTTNLPVRFLFDFKVININSIENVYLSFIYGKRFNWGVGNGINTTFQIGQWKTIQVNVTDSLGNHFDFVEFALGFQTSSAQTMHFKYLIDNLRLVYSDTTILLDDFGDGATNIYDGFNSSELNQYSLSQNYPNPFNSNTIINFSLPKEEYVELIVYDVTGRTVKKLVNEIRSAGNHSVLFNSSDVTSGIYFYQLKTTSFIKTKKLILLR